MGRPHSDFVEPLILTPGGSPGNGRASRRTGLGRERPAGLERETGISASPEVVRHSRYVTLQMAEVAVPRDLFQEILRLIDGLRRSPVPT
jgi:hypothetical protein